MAMLNCADTLTPLTQGYLLKVKTLWFFYKWHAIGTSDLVPMKHNY